MSHKGHAITAMVIGGLFLLLDRWCKLEAQAHPLFEWVRFHGWIGWDYLENPGVAFGIPIPNVIILLFTPLIIIGLAWWYGRKKRTVLHTYAFSFIFFGAVSNYIDRIVFGITIDYLRFVTSVINLGDAMIVIGAILLITQEGRAKPSTQSPPTTL